MKVTDRLLIATFPASFTVTEKAVGLKAVLIGDSLIVTLWSAQSTTGTWITVGGVKGWSPDCRRCG